MASETEPAKLLLPYLQRADELQKHEPLVAYYCRLFAMEKGLRIPQNERTKTTNSLLISLMNQLEKDKKSLKLGPDDNLHLEGFALNVFAKADKQDRAGRADLNTAKTFYAANIFFEILNQFGVLQPDLEQKQKYAAWKAADIRKALKEGRKPTPGPPSGEDDLSVDDLSVSSNMAGGSYDMGPSESTPINPRQEPNPSQFYDSVNNQQSTNVPPPAKFHDNVNDQHPPNIPPSFQYHDNNQHPPHHFHDEVNNHHSTNVPTAPQTYPSAGYPSHDFPSQDFPPAPSHRPETSDYPQPYHHQSYSQEPQQHLPPNFPPESTSFSYPHFQSYPSFSESSIPAVSSHYQSYYQGSGASYAPQSAPPTASHQPTAQYQSSSRNVSVSEPTPPSAKAYEYDSNYQPPPEKIAEAQKAARFAVGALAFDDVSIAVDFLRKSLELLTNPSAKAGQ